MFNKKTIVDFKSPSNRFWGKILILIAAFISVFFGTSLSAEAQCRKKNANKLIEQGNAFFSRKDFKNALPLFIKATETEPQCASAFFDKGQAERQLNQFDKAISSLNGALTLKLEHSERVAAYSSLGFIYLQKGGERWFQEALWHGEEAVKIDPNSVDAWTVVALANTNLGKDEEAIRAWTELTRLSPNDGEIRRNKGVTLYKLKKYREALTEFTELMRNEPKNYQNFAFAAEMHTMLGNYKQAVEMFQQSVQLKPDEGTTYVSLGSAYLALKQYDKAAASYHLAVIYKTPAKAEALSGEGFARLSLGQYKEAASLLDQALENQPVLQKPEDFKAFVLAGLGSSYGQLGEYRKAIGYIRQAKELNLNDKIADINLSWWYSLLGENEASAEAARRAIEKSPKDFSGYTNRCRAHYLLKLYDEALADCQQSLKLEPSDGETLFYYGRILRDTKRKKEADIANKKAIVALEKKLNVNAGKIGASLNETDLVGVFNNSKENEDSDDTPGVMKLKVNIPTPFTPYVLGNAYFDDNQLNKSVIAYLEAIRRSPNFQLAHLNLGIVYTILKKKPLAIEQYNELLKLDRPKAEELKKYIDAK